jgi:uncharacterized membrane protein YecN with MAPEG domain
MTPERSASFLLQAESNSNDATSTGILNVNGLIIMVLVFYIVKSREKDMFWYNASIVFNAKVPSSNGDYQLEFGICTFIPIKFQWKMIKNLFEIIFK